MLTTKLDQDKKRFAEWRAHRKHRQPIPEDLWQIACNHIAASGITKVAREFRLEIRKLREKALHAGIVPEKYRPQTKSPSKTKAAFQEVSLKNVFLPPMYSYGLTVESPNGIRVRIEGSLPDPEYVGKLAACLMGR
jgi:hypothetical protein